MSKAAVMGLTRGMARDLAARGITANVVQPGPVETGMNPADTAFADAMRALLAIKRYGRPEGRGRADHRRRPRREGVTRQRCCPRLLTGPH